MDKEEKKSIALAGVFVALAILLEYLVTFMPKMPQGGKFLSLGMVPIICFSMYRGWRWGVLAGVSFGFLYLILDFSVVHPVQFILDYPLAFGLVGFAGVVSPKSSILKIELATLMACFLRFLAHAISGAVFFSQYAGLKNPWLYSIGYNASYMIPTTVFCMILVPIIVKRMK